MCTSAYAWDNDLVNQKEEQMKPIKPIEITKQDVLGYESFRGVFGSEAAAIDRIEMLMN